MMRLRIGVSEATKELDIEVADSDAVIAAYEKAAEDGAGMFWIEESAGERLGIVTDKILYFAVDAASRSGVGFGPGTD
ncbi:MAG: DUF3107 family protein [Acidimicrobiia bacterium]|nr:DUF3107 family protein [Acidimicrobiia bacterium]MDH3469902.1 DUF3107 family protein [Acidimicrobiia bacterium]